MHSNKMEMQLVFKKQKIDLYFENSLILGRYYVFCCYIV